MSEEILNKLIYNRRYFHKYPDLGWTEYSTAAYISEELESLGFTVKRGKEIMVSDGLLGLPDEEEDNISWERAVNKFGENKLMPFKNNCTAVAGIMEFGQGPTIVCRFDMDALPIEESADKKHYPYLEGFSSVNNGIMHSCGHDAHLAIGLGLAQLIANNNTGFNGKIILLFQPAEEGVRGADAIVRSGFLNNVDYILASHVWSNMPLGKVICSQDGTAATYKYDVEFIGKASHAGICPEKGDNALLAAANAVINLNAISRSSKGYSRVNIGKLESGKARNIIPDYAKLELELRAENTETLDYLRERCLKIVNASSDMQDCKVDIASMGEAKGAVGDGCIASVVYDNAQEIDFFKEIIIKDNICRGSEDFTSMMSYVQENGGKACFIGLGASLPRKELQHHTPNFDIDEDILLPAVYLFYNIVKDIL